MSLTRATSRRSFLKWGAASAITVPFFTRNLLSAPPSGQVRHASFGAAGMAFADVTSLAAHSATRVVAVADVDANRVAEFKKKFPDARVYSDYRVLLEKEKDLDSVNVSTPDHMHGPIGMAALQRGLHVYGQKPLTHDIYETRRLTEVARQKGLVTQMGIQIHSNREYRMAVHLVQSGRIGKVKEVHTWSSKEWGDNGAMPNRQDPVPAGLDWDLWLGVCESRPFLGDGWYHPGNWRKRLDFGTGTFGDMGCHIFDPVFKALALTAPVSVRSEGAAPNSHSWATNAVVRYVFPETPYTIPGTIPITWYDGQQRPSKDILALLGDHPFPDQGSILIGTEGVMVIPHIALPALLPESKFADFKPPAIEGADHWKQFIDAVRGNGKTSAGFDYSGPLTETVLLGSVASRFPKTTLEWNAAKLKFTNVKEANQYVRRRYRKG
ncbi:MAG: Gfo/Idh/MocA family oxidoreductase, partial [Nitrospira sp.]|nr:Gfo/Idh/MocA family oxidoreductase [Nitrospira sp.]